MGHRLCVFVGNLNAAIDRRLVAANINRETVLWIAGGVGLFALCAILETLHG